MKLSASQIKYITVIYELSRTGRVRSNDIALELGVSRPSVHRMLGGLAGKGLVSKENFPLIELTAAGGELAQGYYSDLRRISEFFADKLSLREDTARRSATALLCELDANGVRELCAAISE